jgi:NAD(P)-dependent dehydrogenase (short-subunit alcohol dehydrogenase family)
MPGEGGWGTAYTVSKGGFHRLAIQLAYEYGSEGVVTFNLQPGLVATERVKLVRGPVENVASLGADPSVIGETVAHIASFPENFSSGDNIDLQSVARDLGLLTRSD